MTPHPLEYDPAKSRRIRVERAARLLVAGAVTLLLFQPFVSVRRSTLRVDAVTGSTEWQTTWLGLIQRTPTCSVSPLELRLRRASIQWTRDWRVLSVIDKTVLNRVTSRGCAPAPPVHEIIPVLAQFASASTDAELRDFVRAMQSGTGEEQHAAVNAAIEKAESVMGSRSTILCDVGDQSANAAESPTPEP